MSYYYYGQNYWNNVPPKKKFIPVITILIIVANVIAFFLCQGIDVSYSYTGGINYEYIKVNKEYGRFVSYMFLHANFEHILNNMVALWCVGGFVEEKIGSLRTALIYFGSGIGAAIVSINMYHLTEPDKMHFCIGASGAVFGMICAGALLSVKGEGKLFGVDVGKAIVLVVIYALLTMGGNIDVYGHIGGAIFGGIIAFSLQVKKWEKFEETSFLKAIAILITLWCCIMGIGEAKIGRTPTQLPDERVDFVLEQPVMKGTKVTFEDGLEAFCDNGKWMAFTSDDGREVVQFTGECKYKGRYREVLLQVIVLDNMSRCKVWYVGLDGDGLNSKEIKEFLDAVCASTPNSI